MTRLNSANVKRLTGYIKRNGLKAATFKALERIQRDDSEKKYEKDVFDLISDREEEEYERSVNFTHRYRFSIIVPAYETDMQHLTDMIESVVKQTYPVWELCIADASETDDVGNVVAQLTKKYSLSKSDNGESKIRYLRLSDNKGISGNTNEALKMATGEYVAFLDHDDMLAPNALFEMAMALEGGLVSESGFLTNTIKMLYSDEDKFSDAQGGYFDYHIKPDFDLHLLRTNNYICHFLCVRRELALSIGGFSPEYDGAQDHDFILRCVEKLDKNEIVHIGKILYHWRSHEKSTATNPESKLYAYDAGKRAVEAHLKRLSIDGEVSDTEHLGFYRVKMKVSATDLTKVVIMDLDTLKEKSREELDSSDYEYIMILNDTVKPASYDFIEDMLGILMHDNVGCVGGLVINGMKIESAGYSVSEDGRMVPDFAGMNRHFSGYMHRAKIVREVSGVCTDCMMIRKEAVLESGSLNPDVTVVYSPYSIFKRVKR